jgi:hypothetical protein
LDVVRDEDRECAVDIDETPGLLGCSGEADRDGGGNPSVPACLGEQRPPGLVDVVGVDRIGLPEPTAPGFVGGIMGGGEAGVKPEIGFLGEGLGVGLGSAPERVVGFAATSREEGLVEVERAERDGVVVSPLRPQEGLEGHGEPDTAPTLLRPVGGAQGGPGGTGGDTQRGVVAVDVPDDGGGPVEGVGGGEGGDADLQRQQGAVLDAGGAQPAAATAQPEGRGRDGVGQVGGDTAAIADDAAAGVSRR